MKQVIFWLLKRVGVNIFQALFGVTLCDEVFNRGYRLIIIIGKDVFGFSIIVHKEYYY